MKILIIGAGPLGSIYSVTLTELGFDVTLLARGTRYNAIKTTGIELDNVLEKRRFTTQVNAVDYLPESYNPELIMVIMRKNAALKLLPALVQFNTKAPVLFLGNNIRGAEEYQNILGTERVLLGFAMAAGYFEDQHIRCLYNREMHMLIGEPSGIITPRIQQIQEFFTTHGFPVDISPNIDSYLKCHAALIVPIACGFLIDGNDRFKVAQDTFLIKRFLTAVREAFQVITQKNLPILPKSLKKLLHSPKWLLASVLRKRLKSDYIKIAVCGHLDNARDEMMWLAQEFQKFKGSIATPILDQLIHEAFNL